MTEATTDRPTRQRPLRPLGSFVNRRVTAWQRDYIRRRPEALSILAQLRRGIGKEVGSVPDLWRFTLEGLPGPEPYGEEPTRDERAAHTALTLFAAHQQSRREEMHLPGQSLGTAVRQLQVRSASDDAVRRRFEALGTAETFAEVVNHARGLINQLRTYSIPFDYGAFADDLVFLQTSAADHIRLRWGRDFYRVKSASDQSSADADPTDEEES